MTMNAPSGPRVGRAALAALAALALLLSGCSLLDEGSKDTGLKKALHRISDSPQARADVEYGDLAAFDELGVNRAKPDSPWFILRGFGASLDDYAEMLPEKTGIRLDQADYAVSAGDPGGRGTLIAGGQLPAAIADTMRRTGWKDDGDELVVTDPERQLGETLSTVGIVAARARPFGSDVAFGTPKVDLDQIGSPDGAPLAKEVPTAALADCLGDVMAAALLKDTGVAMRSRRDPKLDAPPQPRRVGVGVRTTDDADSTPRAVMCTYWDSAEAADDAAKRQRQAVASGRSQKVSVDYDKLYRDSQIESDGQLVRLEADTKSSSIIFNGLRNADLPGLAPRPKR